MKNLDTVCIRCPIGCHLHIEDNNGNILVTGNRCPRGAEYGKQEFVCPMRTITTIYPLKNGGTLAVRTNKAVKKEIYFDVLNAIKSAPEPRKPKFGDVLIKNVMNSGVDVVITECNFPEDK